MDLKHHIGLHGIRGLWWYVVSCGALFYLCTASLAQTDPAPNDEPESALKTVQLLGGGQLKLSWVNKGAKSYELYRRERLDQGSWIKVTDLEPVRESIQTYELPVETDATTTFYLIQKIPDPLASMRTLHLGEDISMEFAHIPAGSFIMGSPKTEMHRESDESPLTEVTISKSFLLGKYEVTQAQWKVVMGTNPSRFKGDHLPVERVSWILSNEYCERLTEQERSAGRLPEGYKYTLPTEAQREYACRGETQTRFYYGDDPGYGELSQYAWYWTNSGSKTHPVGEKKPNTWGLYDMHGNVWEWCLDYYANAYAGGSVTDPMGPQSGAVRLIRGGGWEDFARDCRSASRMRTWPGNSFSYLGFRVALVEVQTR